MTGKDGLIKSVKIFIYGLLLISLLLVSYGGATDTSTFQFNLPPIAMGALVGALSLLLIISAMVFVNLGNNRQWLLLSATGLSLISLEYWLEGYVSERFEQEGRATSLQRLNVARANLEGILNNNLSLITGMGIAIAAKPDLTESEFTLYAQEVLRAEPLLLNFAAAPGMVVRMIHPKEGNEAVLGLDFSRHKAQRNDALRIKNERIRTVAGPVELVQGGLGFIGRAPVFYTDPATQEEQFWGLVSTTMLVNAVYDKAGITELASKQQLAMRKKPAKDKADPVFFGEEFVFLESPIITEMKIGAEVWQLASVHLGQPEGLQSTLYFMRLVFFALVILISEIIVIRVRQSTERSQLIEALSYREAMLESFGAMAKVGGWEYKTGHGFVFWSSQTYAILQQDVNKGPMTDPQFRALIIDKHKRALWSAVATMAETPSDSYAEVEVILPSGEHKWIGVRAYSNSVGKGSTLIKGVIQDITERKLSELTVLRQASYDALTQLPNRSLFDTRLEQAVASAARSGEIFAVVYIDLDRFKVVNDSLGHLAGDLLLQQVTQRLLQCVRGTDTLSRRSGDEFTLIATQLASNKVIEVIARNILAQLKQPFVIDNNQIYVTASLGITLYPDDGLDANTLLKNADQAMYAAKDMGRNTFQYFTSLMQTDADHRLRLHVDLVEAIKHNQLEVFYQPILDVRTTQITECEALLRWRHQELGFISPDDFIPLAEEVGLIKQLGQFVMTRAIKDINDINTRFNSDIGLALNKSYREFLTDRDGAPLWVDELLTTKHRPRVIVEITESILMEDDNVYLLLDRLRQAGIKVAIDDFGTGYSSLAYLKRFPVDVLKVDRSFIRDIAQDTEDLSLVEAILAMAKTLGLKVVAEGVETQEQLTILDGAHCDLAQGYHFAKPMALGEFEGWLETHRSRELASLG